MDRQKMVSENMGLVFSIAKSYQGRGLDHDDLIQEGTLGLIRATEDYDPARGAFSTHATFWIKQTINRAIKRDGRGIALPEYVIPLLDKWNKTALRLWQSTESEPTDAEIVAAAGFSDAEYQQVQNALSIDKVASIDIPDADGNNRDVADKVKDDVGDNLSVRQYVDGLGEREREILSLRYGLLDGIPRTLEEVAKAKGTSKQRIQQIEASALDRLRHRMKSPKYAPTT